MHRMRRIWLALARGRAFLYTIAILLIIVGIGLLCIDNYSELQAQNQAEQLKEQLETMYRSDLEAVPQVKMLDVRSDPKGVEPISLINPESDSFMKVKELNADIVGWIRIDGTKVNYPVVQYSDNDRYLHTDALGRPSKHGSIFVDYRFKLQQPQRSLILYGHHMLDGSMFGDLTKYKDRGFYESHPEIFFGLEGREQRWRVFSVYTIDAAKEGLDYTYSSDQIYADALLRYHRRSLHPSNRYDVPRHLDEVLTLVTCSNESEDSRLVIHAVKSPFK
jgi:sortase B